MEETLPCRQTKIWLPKPNPKISKNLLNNTKDTFGRVVRWVTGHNFLNRHKNLLDPDTYLDKYCRFCFYDEETSWHLAAECGAFNTLRFKHFDRYQLLQNPEWTGRDLSNFLQEEERG